MSKTDDSAQEHCSALPHVPKTAFTDPIQHMLSVQKIRSYTSTLEPHKVLALPLQITSHKSLWAAFFHVQQSDLYASLSRLSELPERHKAAHREQCNF
jgi:hypothetical protein